MSPDSETTGPLRYALLAGTAYFLCMSVAHFFGIKVPVLFVYWDTPYFAYQDKIIAFSVLTYAALFYTAAQHRVAVPAALFSIVVTTVGLSLVNVSSALDMALAAGQTETASWSVSWTATGDPASAGLARWPYWIQTALIASYALLLIVLSRSTRPSSQVPRDHRT